MRYGLPYKGSKNLIAEKIVDFLPQAENFYDLCENSLMSKAKRFLQDVKDIIPFV